MKLSLKSAACRCGLKRITALIAAASLTLTISASPDWEASRAFASGVDDTPEAVQEQQEQEKTPLAITSQPEDVTLSGGEAVSFSVRAEGDGLSYQWYYRKEGSSAWSVWKGHTDADARAVANSTWNLMKVRCLITDADGESVMSRAATVSLRQPLEILAQPEDVTVKTGGTAYFRVTARGTGRLQYQWYYKKAGASGFSKWKGHTTATTFASANTTWNLMRVYCVITDESGETAETQPATVILDQPLEITLQPENVTAAAGEQAVFSLKARGTGNISYQWYTRPSGTASDMLMEGETSSTFTATAGEYGEMKVWCVVSDGSGASVKSGVAKLILSRPLIILSQPENAGVKSGDTVYFRVAAQGTGRLNYQWYYRKYGAEEWSLWKGHTTATTFASANGTWNLMEVYCTVTDESGGKLDSERAFVKVSQPLKIVTQPKSVTVKVGRTAQFSVKPQGTGEYTYRWYSRENAEAQWIEIEGQTARTLTLMAEENLNGTQVRCRVQDESGTYLDTEPATLTAVPAIKITSQPAQATVHSGETASFTVNATGSGLKYQWYYKKAGKSEWTLWKGMTGKTASGKADCTWHVMQVFCRVTDEIGEIADSKTAFAMITKKSNQRYIIRTFKVKSNGTKIYSGPGTNYTALGTLKAGEIYTALEWGSDSNDVTWFRFNWNGKSAWISRKKTNVSDQFVTIPDRSFKDGGVPIIYLSPSRQVHNEYAVGSTTEQKQMYRVGEALKKILEDEYICVVYMPPVSLEINLNGRPQDAYNKEADIYLAIHSNAHTTKRMYGAVGYYFPGCSQSKALGQNMAEEMGKISPFTPTVASSTTNGMSAFDNIGYGEVRDPAYFGMVSLLAEVEYHDNADSANWIIRNPDKIARALANALEKTFQIQKRS